MVSILEIFHFLSFFNYQMFDTTRGVQSLDENLTSRFKSFILTFTTELIRCELVPLHILTDFRAHLKLGENKRYPPFIVKVLFYLCGETYLSRSQQLLLVLCEGAPRVNLVSAQW